jgi:hypothetical protein
MSATWRVYEQDLIYRGLEPVLARELMWSGIRSGSLKVVTQAAMVEDQILDGQIADSLVVNCVLRVLNPLVVTSPVGMQEGILTTIRAFKMIIAAACSRLFIVSPYIDDTGVRYLAEPLRSVVERGGKIYLLTRETAAKQISRSHGLEALARLAGDRLSVRDYHTQAQGMSHFTSTHAKLVLADETLGYVGSAEVRGNALDKNFEMGAIIRGDAASQAVRAFEAVWQVAKVV